MHFDVKWGLLLIGVLCIAIAGKKMPMLRWLGAAASVGGIGWACVTKDFGLVPFNVILLLTAGLEYVRAQKSAKIIALDTGNDQKKGREAA